MNTLKVGDKLPNFECIDENENLISNEDYSGKKLIVFFYPKAIHLDVLQKLVIYLKIMKL